MPNRLNINKFIAFTATEFHAALTTLFFIDYAQRSLIEGFELHSSLDNILMATSQSPLGQHTNLVSIHCDAQTSALGAVELIFTHTTWHLWGSRLPASCPKCSSPQCWSKPAKSGSTYIYSCRRSGCSGTCSFQKPAGFELHSSSVNSVCWMERAIKL